MRTYEIPDTPDISGRQRGKVMAVRFHENKNTGSEGAFVEIQLDEYPNESISDFICFAAGETAQEPGKMPRMAKNRLFRYGLVAGQELDPDKLELDETDPLSWLNGVEATFTIKKGTYNGEPTFNVTDIAP